MDPSRARLLSADQVWKFLDGDQQKAAYDKAREECVASHLRVNFRSTVDDKFGRVAVNGKVGRAELPPLSD